MLLLSMFSFSLFYVSGSGSDVSDRPALNALYAIDPNANGGLDYQYDEVVRNRDARRRMHGGDCECCRDVSVCNVHYVLIHSSVAEPLLPNSTTKALGLSQNGCNNRSGARRPARRRSPTEMRGRRAGTRQISSRTRRRSRAIDIRGRGHRRRLIIGILDSLIRRRPQRSIRKLRRCTGVSRRRSIERRRGVDGIRGSE
jgi:hypothetical protein